MPIPDIAWLGHPLADFAINLSLIGAFVAISAGILVNLVRRS